MPPHDLHEEGAVGPPAGDLASAGTYPTEDEGFEHGLVVLAMGRPFWLVPDGPGFSLLVEAHALGDVREQLDCFDRESVNWPPRPADPGPPLAFELSTPLAWAAVVVAAYCCQGLWPGLLEDAGELDSRAVFGRGEWWRAVTALFLHADAGHLVSNLLAGVFAFSAVVTTFGRRRGWAGIAAASVAGNLAIAALNYPGEYRSLGASTAIFAALGLLTGRALRAVWRDGTRRGWRSFVAPLAAGIGILGLYGAGGVNVDVGAHATGFLSGLLIGAVLGPAAGRPAQA